MDFNVMISPKGQLRVNYSAIAFSVLAAEVQV